VAETVRGSVLEATLERVTFANEQTGTPRASILDGVGAWSPWW
jgi:hypothetical protein